jgi:hypothetical protein
MPLKDRIPLRHGAQLHTIAAEFLNKRDGSKWVVERDVVADGFEVCLGLIRKDQPLSLGPLGYCLVFGLKPVQHRVAGLNPASIGIRNALGEDRIKGGKPLLPLLDEANAFAQHFALRIVAAGADELIDDIFEPCAQIGANGHDDAPAKTMREQ